MVKNINILYNNYALFVNIVFVFYDANHFEMEAEYNGHKT